MKKLIILFCFLTIICGCTNGEEKMEMKEIKKISCNEKIALLNEGAILIDVRSSSEFDESHLEGAINIEYGTIEDNIVNVVDDKTKKIIVYCQSGVRSEIAANVLVNMGYTNVYDLGSIEKCR